MSTEPVLPPDEAPLDSQTVDLFLSNAGEDMVLVGGQALAFWMDRFQIGAEGAAISNGGDALGSAERARELAPLLKARLVLPRKTSRTALVAQLRVPVPGGAEHGVELLASVDVETLSQVAPAHRLSSMRWSGSSLREPLGG